MEPNLPAADPASELLLAERYRILKPLGRGGMAAVFEAHDCVTDRVVALKRLQLRGEANSYVAIGVEWTGLLFHSESTATTASRSARTKGGHSAEP